MVVCKVCGFDDYQIQLLYSGCRDNLAIVLCPNCGEIIPVVVDSYMTPDDFYLRCEETWKRANIKPGDETMKKWIGVDLDGTLAHYDGWKGPDHIGPAIPKMLERVHQKLREGHTMKIFTARATLPEQIPPVKRWLEEHGLGHLEVTNVKDFWMVDLWDDRCRQVETNTGEFICKSTS